MQVSPIQQTRRSSAFRWIVVLCLALLSITATAQVMHYHANEVLDGASHCSLCLVMHSAAAVTYAVEINISFQTAAYLFAWTSPGHSSASASFALFCRPPPLA